MNKYILEKVEDNKIGYYDNFIINSKYGDLLQTSNWARVKKDSYKSYRYILKENDNIVATAQLMYRKLIAGMKMCYISRGPILDYKNEDILVYFLEQLKLEAKKNKAIYMIIDPSIPVDFGNVHNILLKLGFKRKKFNYEMDEIQPRYNMIIDISNDINEVKEKFNKICKNMIKSSEKMPFIILSPDDNIIKLKDMFEDFYSIMKETATRDKITIRACSYFENMYNIFKEKEEVIFQNIYIKRNDAIEVLKNKEKSLLSEKKSLEKKYKNSNDNKYQNEIKNIEKALEGLSINLDEVNSSCKSYLALATVFIIISGKKAYYLYGGSKELFRNNGSVYKNILHSIKKVKEKGCESFDMGGVSGRTDYDINDSHSGLYKFKSNWGADMVEYIGEYKYDLKPVSSKLIDELIKVRKKLVKR